MLFDLHAFSVYFHQVIFPSSRLVQVHWQNNFRNSHFGFSFYNLLTICPDSCWHLRNLIPHRPIFIIIRLHRSTTYVDTAYCYWLSSVVCRSVTLVSPAKTAGPINMPFGLWPRVGPRNHVLDGSPDSPMGRGNFEGEKRSPVVKYRDTLCWAVQKWLNRSRCRLGCGLGWAQGIVFLLLLGCTAVLRT